MQYVIEGPNVKTLAKSIQALAKIGDDLYIECLPSEQLIFRTVNSSRSAYVCITFSSNFFIEFNNTVETKCKVSLKSCLMAFRSLPTMEKSVEKCLLDTGQHDSVLLVQFYCKHDMTKIYHLPFIENETVQAAFQNQVYQCKLTAQTRLLIDGIQNFSNSVEEVTLTINTDKVTLKNYVDEDLVEQDKTVHTILMLEPEEFENYEVEEETEVTFCLKEFRAAINFSEGFNVPMIIGCQSAGKPIMFSIDGIPGLLANFVLATLADRDAQSIASQTVPRQMELLPRKSKPTRPEKKKQVHGKNRPPTLYTAVHVIDVTDQSNSETDCVAPSSPSEPLGNSQMQHIKPSTSRNTCSQNLEGNNENDDEDDDDVIALTPPQKRFRSDFLGLSQASHYTSVAPEPDEVLAEASDDDYD